MDQVLEALQTGAAGTKQVMVRLTWRQPTHRTRPRPLRGRGRSQSDEVPDGKGGVRVKPIIVKVLTLVVFVTAALTSVARAADPAASPAADPLPSWNDGAAKKSIVEFVAKATTQGSPDFVPPAERIAVFDNDGTLWAEQPMYFQAFFMLDRVKALAPQHPEWKTQEPFASLLKGDMKAALAGGERAVWPAA